MKALQVNHDYFKNPQTEEQSYWLGYLLADGSVDKTMRVNLGSIDLEHLEKFKKAISSHHKISTTKDGKFHSFTFTSKTMCKDLEQYGITPKKTYKNLYLPELPDNLMRHTIRGVIDGDGWINKYITKTGRSDWSVGICANSQSILDDINNFLFRKVGVKTNVNLRHCQQYSRFIMSIGGNKKVLKVLDLIYNQSKCYLLRKNIKAQSMIAMHKDKYHANN